MDLSAFWNKVQTEGVDIGLKVLGAIVLWIVGRWLVGLAVRMIEKILDRRHVDMTLRRYLASFLNAILTVVLVVAMLGFFGIETTSFAAILAAAGVAIGMAWSGLLANFAAGAFLLILRPFKVDDFVELNGQIGTVAEIGMFVTQIDSMDNVRVLIGNNKVFSETIRNFSTNPVRRVDLVAQRNHSVNVDDAIQRLSQGLRQISNVSTEPAPVVVILEFNLAGPVLAVRPFCHTDHYWDVYFATNKLIRDSFGQAGYPIPENHYHIRKSA